MNRDRRNRIAAAAEKLEEIRSIVEEIRSDEESAFENMPENQQYGDRGDAMQAAMDALEYAAGSIEEAVENLNSAAE